VALATATADGRPSVRVVLLRQFDAGGFTFFTNYGSRKAEELDSNPRAALCWYWYWLEEQVRIEGRVSRATAEESDAYFAARPRGSQIGAWASKQSTPLSSRAALEARVRECESRFADGDVPRPRFWGGYRLVPDRIEFWSAVTYRLHDRLVYIREGDGWRTERLFP
jgi:pyridoxamine 5'-phosphate oxidase